MSRPETVCKCGILVAFFLWLRFRPANMTTRQRNFHHAYFLLLLAWALAILLSMYSDASSLVFSLPTRRALVFDSHYLPLIVFFLLADWYADGDGGGPSWFPPGGPWKLWSIVCCFLARLPEYTWPYDQYFRPSDAVSPAMLVGAITILLGGSVVVMHFWNRWAKRDLTTFEIDSSFGAALLGALFNAVAEEQLFRGFIFEEIFLIDLNTGLRDRSELSFIKGSHLKVAKDYAKDSHLFGSSITQMTDIPTNIYQLRPEVKWQNAEVFNSFLFANFVQSVVFGILHFYGIPSGLTGVGLTFVYGFLLAFLQYWHNSMLLPVFVHAVADFFIFHCLASQKNKAS